ncbi:hypothetical protein B0T24DRAFT_592916 [Lasiosphaeria ovina]|uniref:Methyltransferase domain-containing protein n=1 Tax=Lasiosphaeria ovina TaxID=92902 RepID=A0AAE0KID3_9PEZI|nr:hypothetical protein B0T24DRAFT_592916 [Lasiosphaeria ovina]
MPEVDTRDSVDRSKRFQAELPADAAKRDPAWRLLEQYAGVPADEVEAHLHRVRDKAWQIFPYGCIGRWRFLDLYIATLPQYGELIARTQRGAVLLDCACCFGQALRQLAADGAPAQNLAGLDLRREFVDLGYELFRDRGTFAARFVVGDMLDSGDARVGALDGAVDVVHAASFFHLFGWADQVAIGARMVKFFREGITDAVVLGRQIGSAVEPLDPEEHEKRGLGRYHHNQKSMQRLWDEIGRRTGTAWAVEAELATALEDNNGEVAERTTIRFVVRQRAS